MYVNVQRKAKVVVGLGNPGPEYQWTRHNIGAHVTKALAEKYGFSFRSERSVGVALAKGIVDETHVVIAIPQTYMNESGRSVSRLLRETGVALEDLLVVIDDIETPWGGIQRAFAGGTRGHNGLRSINGLLGSMSFTQLRFGVGRPGTGSVADYVLHRFSSEEMTELPDLIDRAVESISEWLNS